MKKPSRVRIGRYVMFDAVIGVWLDYDSRDADARWGWTEDGYVTITVGGGHKEWAQVVSGALHEVVEAAFVLRRCHYKPTSSLNVNYTAMDQFTFVASHREFSEIMAHAGDALTYILPDLERAWMQGRKKKR